MAISRSIRLLAVLLVFFTGALAAAADVAKNGAWWQSAPREEQLGYLAGYIDCATYDAGQYMGRQSWYTLAPEISALYAKRPDKLTQPVAAILKDLVRADPSKPSDGGGENYEEKHGFFDGEYWRKALPEQRLGFVEGYLDCWRTEGMKGAKFSKPSGKYVAQLSEWFGVNDDNPGEVRADRATIKIADALWIFRDR